jgi:hypothetical protein
MLHLLYILTFTLLAGLAVVNLVRNLMMLSASENKRSQAPNRFQVNSGEGVSRQRRSVPHPEFLDETGQLIEEPLLVMRSVNVEEARQRLDALYNASPNPSTGETPEEA